MKYVVGVPPTCATILFAKSRNVTLCVFEAPLRADAVASIECADVISTDVCPPILVELSGGVTPSRNALVQFANELNIAAMALVGPPATDSRGSFHRGSPPALPDPVLTQPQPGPDLAA